MGRRDGPHGNFSQPEADIPRQSRVPLIDQLQRSYQLAHKLQSCNGHVPKLLSLGGVDVKPP